ncbi:MAG TPA: DUF6625 family protein [Opitutaceae bacterium]|jgi:hypothetical protein
MLSTCIIVPYFGQWPEWFWLFLESCGRNRSFNWLFVTDCPQPRQSPPNCRFVSMSWADCAARIADVCALRHPPTLVYKICDFRFAFGDIFSDYVGGFDYWGFGDIDVIYGDLESGLAAEIWEHELVTFNRTHVSGHLSLLRNDPKTVRRYQVWRPWRENVEESRNRRLDEDAGYYGIENVYAIESYNTPLSPFIPWVDGTYRFPYVWYYRQGTLSTNTEGKRQFLYLHFMRYKNYWRKIGLGSVMHERSGPSPGGWKLMMDGFHPCSDGDSTREDGWKIALVSAGRWRSFRVER